MIVELIKQYWIDLGFGVFTAFLAFCYKNLKIELLKRVKEQEAVKEGVVALLRQALYDNYNKWSERGYCPIYAMEVSKKIYEQYHSLGGNDVGTELYERLKELPTEPTEINKIISDNKFMKEH
ncbi:MAG: hypothetical protein Q4D26_07760 [Clostridia bacterium]|nr:hypothetical protein [Clostridia bacterium]